MVNLFGSRRPCVDDVLKPLADAQNTLRTIVADRDSEIGDLRDKLEVASKESARAAALRDKLDSFLGGV